MAMTWNDKALDRLKEQVAGSDSMLAVWKVIDDLKQLNKENVSLRCDIILNTFSNLVAQAAVRDIKEENEAMREALDFYADYNNWVSDDEDTHPAAWRDVGQRARVARMEE